MTDQPHTRSTSTALEHFKKTPWTSKWAEDSDYTAPLWCNHDNETAEYNGFFMQTLNTPATVPHMAMLVRNDLQLPEATNAPSPPKPGRPSKMTSPPDVAFLVTLGRGGLDGWPGVSHGGVSAALLDHPMGHTPAAHRMNMPPEEASRPMFTGNMSVSYFGPVRTAGKQFVVKCWLTTAVGTKWTVRGQIVDENDAVLVQADALWIVGKPMKKNPLNL